MNRPLLRAFVALPLPTTLQTRIDRETRFLREKGWSVKWVEPRHLHVTVKFLGDVADEQIVALVRSLQEVAESHGPISARLVGIGAFPDHRRARTLWVGFDEGHSQLVSLGKAVESSCARLGYRRERRRFSPHVTLGRVRGPSDARSMAEVLGETTERTLGAVEFQELHLYSSQLSSLGPEYSRLATLPLEG